MKLTAGSSTLSDIKLPFFQSLQIDSLPIGGLTVATVVIFFSSPAKQTPKQSLVQKLRGLDAAGAVLLISAIICLLLALQWGGTTYSWSDSKVFGCLIGFGLLLIAFSVLQVYLGDQ